MSRHSSSSDLPISIRLRICRLRVNEAGVAMHDFDIDFDAT